MQSVDGGDCLLAYANEYGVVGSGIIGAHETYRIATDDSLPTDFESRHRHFRHMDWHVFVANLVDAVPFSELNLGTAPRHTKAELSSDNARRIVELLAARPNANTNVFTSEVVPSRNYPEGSVQSVLVNRFERSPKARGACIEHWGLNCACCGMNFKSVYGDVGDRFIHVHHIRLISEIGETYSIDPVADLRPVCPNCHAMLHRNPPATIESLQSHFKNATHHT